MLTDKDVAQFHADGFLNGGLVLEEGQVEELRSELQRVIEQHDNLTRKPILLRDTGRDSESTLWQIVNMWEASDAYRELIANRKIVKEIAQLTGAGELRIWHDQIQYKPAHVGGINMWHQDAPLWPIIAPMTEVSAWVALDDIDESNGCMSMVPGSHTWGDCTAGVLAKITDFNVLPAEFDGHTVAARPCQVRKGEVHYHHGLTWHGSHANLSGRPRRAIALHYMTGGTRYVASGMHEMKPYVEVADGEIMSGPHFPLVYP